ncbi:MAG: TolC family protein [Azoarcus sp.]|jgi:outer membrane protein TolC|nr:TolC family protein [Azoarcus sp.]
MISRIFAYAVCCVALPSGAATPTSQSASAQPSILGGTAVNVPNNGTAILRLADAILLGLANNSKIRSAYSDRAAQKSVFRATEERFFPKLPLNGKRIASQNPSDQRSQTELYPTATMQSKTGAHFSLSWNNRISQDEHEVTGRGDDTSFTVVQPPMRGAWGDIVPAPLRQARLNEQINRLALKATVSDVVTQIIFTYHEVLRAQKQSQLAQEALARARRSLAYDTYRAAAGYWLESDFTGLVRAEADIENRELALEEIENRLDASRQPLLRLLGLDAGTKIRVVDPLKILPVKVGVAKTITAALKRQPAYLIQHLLAERATIELAMAHVHARNQDSRLIKAKKALEHDIGEGVRDLDVRWRQCEAARRSLKLARTKLEAERKRIKKAPWDSFRMLVFESDLYDAEFARIDTFIAYRNALATLDKASGTTLESWGIELND